MERLARGGRRAQWCERESQREARDDEGDRAGGRNVQSIHDRIVGWSSELVRKVQYKADCDYAQAALRRSERGIRGVVSMATTGSALKSEYERVDAAA